MHILTTFFELIPTRHWAVVTAWAVVAVVAMGLVLSRVQALGAWASGDEWVPLLLGAVVGWTALQSVVYLLTTSPASQTRTRRSMEAISHKNGTSTRLTGDSCFHFAIPETLDIRRQAQLVRDAAHAAHAALCQCKDAACGTASICHPHQA